MQAKNLKHIFTDNDQPKSSLEVISNVDEGIYQSGLINFFPQEIQAVLCLCSGIEVADPLRYGYYPNPFAAPHLKAYEWRPMFDDPREAPSVEWLNEILDRIQQWRGHGWNVLIHCTVGISRSSLVTCAWIMRQHNLPMNQALEYLRENRKCARPNLGFLNLLLKMEETAQPVRAAA